jgi:hypothetical protein
MLEEVRDSPDLSLVSHDFFSTGDAGGSAVTGDDFLKKLNMRSGEGKSADKDKQIQSNSFSLQQLLF